jgi:hypothetical protein
MDYKYLLTFIGRKKGAIGVFYAIEQYISSPKPLDDAKLRRRVYDRYEHILGLKVNGREVR